MSSQPRRYALLVGVNQYPDKPMMGCVRDVSDIKSYLDTTSLSIQTAILTATGAPNGTPPYIAEPPSLWPTRDNFISHIETIASSACPGDFIYIHYSGHGTTISPASGWAHSHKSTADFALVLLGTDGASERYVRGHELASYLRRMVARGARVSVVLDCCYSGSVLRGEDGDSRFLPYDAAVDAASPRLSREQPLDPGGDPGNGRDGSLLPNWLIDPQGYAIITACAPHEEAKELRLQHNWYVGALSHFMRRALLRLGGGDARLSDLYLSVCARFADHSWPPDRKQMPMFFGNKDLSFLGELRTDVRSNGIPVFRRERHVMIRAGQAHGLSDGDRFALYPLGSGADPPGTVETMIQAEVAEAGPLTSRLAGFPGPSIIPDTVTAGWKAKLISRPPLPAFPVGLPGDIPHLDTLLKASSKRPSLALQLTSQGAWPNSFCIGLNMLGEYEIRDESCTAVPGFASVQAANLEREAIADRVVDALDHLVRFRQIQGILNSSAPLSFQESFSIGVRSRGVFQDTTDVIHATDGEDLELDIKNKGQAPIYVHIFDMGPLWQVENIFGGDYEVIPPRDLANGCTGEETLTLTMSVPRELTDAGVHVCEDVIKIFVTDGPTSFASLDMARLSDASSSKSGVEDLRALPVLQDSPTVSASRGRVGNWVAMNIRIRTTSLAD